MTKRMGLIALGLSMALLSGCGAVDDLVEKYTDEEEYQEEYQEQQDEVLNIPSVVGKNIIGIWSQGCVNTLDGSSGSGTLIFSDAINGSYEGADYNAPGCNPGDEVDSWSGAFTYIIGEATKGAGGEDAVDLDLVLSESGNTMDYYTMVRFTAADKFIMADDGDENSDADTPETRENIFEGEEKWEFTKQ